jgi:hypothetical protein
MFTVFDKALAAGIVTPIVGFILAALGPAGITPEMTIEQAVTAIVQGAAAFVAVYFTRNRA